MKNFNGLKCYWSSVNYKQVNNTKTAIRQFNSNEVFNDTISFPQHSVFKDADFSK